MGCDFFFFVFLVHSGGCGGVLDVGIHISLSAKLERISGELMHLGGLRTLHGLRLDGTAVLPVAAGDIDSFRAVTGCDIVIVPEQNKQRR